MDYIKTFEGFFDFLKRKKITTDTQDIKKDLLYEVMDGDTGQKWIEDHEKLEFNVEEMEKVRSYFPDMDLRISPDDHKFMLLKSGGLLVGHISSFRIGRTDPIDLRTSGGSYYPIYHLDVFSDIKFSIKKFMDDWYVIKCDVNYSHPGTGYFLCDTFDGVTQFIENKEYKKYINNGTDFTGPR